MFYLIRIDLILVHLHCHVGSNDGSDGGGNGIDDSIDLYRSNNNGFRLCIICKWEWAVFYFN